MLGRLFKLRDAGTSLRTELVGGATTFVTLSYNIFVQPAEAATVPAVHELGLHGPRGAGTTRAAGGLTG
jgi:xanthine/uracil/vitamin C permease (AzgA family)